LWVESEFQAAAPNTLSPTMQTLPALALLLVAMATSHVDARSKLLEKILGPDYYPTSSSLLELTGSTALPPGLQKPVIVSLTEQPSMKETLEALTGVLGKEPEAAASHDPEQGDFSEEALEEEEAAELALSELMDADTCDALTSTVIGCPKKTKAAPAAPSQPSSLLSVALQSSSGSQSSRPSSPLSSSFRSLTDRGDSDSQSSSSFEGSSSGISSSSLPGLSSESLMSEGSLSITLGSDSFEKSTPAQIKKLESQIKFAMALSKTIPENVRRLEQLKEKEERLTEVRAKKEAARTLEEHQQLMGELEAHIVKLRAKLNELIQKRSQLAVSDSRLRNELESMSESASTSTSIGSRSKRPNAH
jgi:hypothetical protein